MGRNEVFIVMYIFICMIFISAIIDGKVVLVVDQLFASLNKDIKRFSQ